MAVSPSVRIDVTGARGESFATILRRIGDFDVVPTDSDALVMQKFSDEIQAATIASSRLFPDVAAGIAGTSNGEYFSTPEPGSDFLVMYRNSAGAALEVNRYPSKTGVQAGLPRNGTGISKTAIGAFHNIPATTNGGDDAPNAVIGSLLGTELSAQTYGNLIFTPRGNDVSGGVGYRNRLGGSTSLSVILGGDNDINALAAFNVGHHNRADTTGGATPSHPIMVGTFLHVTGAYAVALGTNHAVHGIKAAIVGGDNNRIGIEGSPEVGRNSVIVGGYLNTADGQHAVALGGQLLKATRNFSVVSGYGATANDIGERCHATHYNAVVGDTYHRELHMNRIVVGGGAVELLNGGVARQIIGSKTTIHGSGKVTAVRTDSEGETATWRVAYEISNMGGTLTVKSFTATVVNADVVTGSGRNAWVCDMIIAAGVRPALRVRGESSPATTLYCAAELNELVARYM